MNSAIGTILIIEDEPDIRRFVRLAIEAEGGVVHEAKTRADGLQQANSAQPDLLIVDLGLPDGDGIELIRDVRHWSEMPILVLSARTQEKDKIAALDAGADDYLTKPFNVGELQARLRALLRRHQRQSSTTSCVQFGTIRVDFSLRQVWRDQTTVHLTPIEYNLLATLIANAGKVMTQRTLLREVWGNSFSESSHYLRVYIGHLRQKLEDNPTQPQHLLTVTGIGYRFQP